MAFVLSLSKLLRRTPNGEHRPQRELRRNRLPPSRTHFSPARWRGERSALLADRRRRLSANRHIRRTANCGQLPARLRRYPFPRHRYSGCWRAPGTAPSGHCGTAPPTAKGVLGRHEPARVTAASRRRATPAVDARGTAGAGAVSYFGRGRDRVFSWHVVASFDREAMLRYAGCVEVRRLVTEPLVIPGR